MSKRIRKWYVDDMSTTHDNLAGSIATGKMVKEMRALLNLNSTAKWGQRVVKTSDYDELLQKFNSFNKSGRFLFTAKKNSECPISRMGTQEWVISSS